MLRLRSCILTHLLSSPSASPVPLPLHRLISAAASSVSPIHGFAVEEYLVDTCGLTRAQALRASAKLSHLKCPSNPDAVLAFLAGLGLSSADVAAAVAGDPKLLCTDVDKTLAPNVAELTSIGLSRSQIAQLVTLGRSNFRCRSIVSKLQYYLPLFGSPENLIRTFKQSSSLLRCSLETTVKPNIALLKECGIDACDIGKLGLAVRRVLTTHPERLQAIVVWAEDLGVPRGSRMFRHALDAVAFLSEEKIAAKVECLKNTLRLSDAEVRSAVSKAPSMLRRSKDVLQSKSEFFISEVGLEPVYIANRPAMLGLSLEGRLRPRNYVMMFLKANGLLDHDGDYFNSVMISEKLFMEKYIYPHKEVAPHLAQDYASACRGEVPARFIFA